MCISVLNEIAESYKPLIGLCQAALTGIVAIAAVCIARRQHLTAANKLKLDLFERRLEIYNSIQEFLDPQTSDWQHRDRALMNKPRLQSLFIFDENIKEWVDEIWSSYLTLLELSRQNNQLDKNQIQRYTEITSHLESEWRKMPQLFSKHLTIEAS